MFQTAEEEGGEGVWSERAGEFSIGRWEGELKGWYAFLNWHNVSYCDLKCFQQGWTQNELLDALISAAN